MRTYDCVCACDRAAERAWYMCACVGERVRECTRAMTTRPTIDLRVFGVSWYRSGT